MSYLEWFLFAAGLAVLIGWMGVCLWHIITNLKN